LPLIVTVLRVIHELERVGDLMVNVDKTIRRLGSAEFGPKVRGILEAMGRQATAQVLRPLLNAALLEVAGPVRCD